MTSESKAPVPVSMKSTGDRLVIEWSDGAVHSMPWTFVRRMCPCATCRMEREQPRPPSTLLPVLGAQEAQPLRVLGMRPVGNYAYAIHFNDGHNTGIYSLEYLRTLGGQASLETAGPPNAASEPTKDEPA